MARKTKLTPELQKKITGAIAAGNYHETACALAGVSTSSFYRWMQQGEKARAGIYREFWEAVKKAEAVAEAKRVKIIADAAEENWQAAAWYLERRYPDRWGRRKHELDIGGDLEIKVTLPEDFG
jgi:transposase